MATLWTTFLELFELGLFGLTQFYGGQLGPAIVAFGVLSRLALLPLTVRLALAARTHGRRLRALRPELLAAQARWKDEPQRLAEETLALYRRHDASPVDPSVLRGSLVQAPIFLGVFHAVRNALAGRASDQAFLWLSSLARPDLSVAVLAFTVVGLGSVAGASGDTPRWVLAVPAITSGVMALTLSAGFGLYLVATGAVGVLQGLLVRRIEGG